MLMYSGYGEALCGGMNAAMPKEEAGSALMTGQESPSSASVSSAIFDSPSSVIQSTSRLVEPSQFSLRQPEQPVVSTALVRPGKTSAGPPALIPDFTPRSNFAMPSGCTFHTGCDSGLGMNNIRRSRPASALRRRKSTRAATTLSTATSILHTGHCNIERQQHQSLIPGHFQNNHPDPHGLRHPNTQQHLGRILVAPLTDDNTGMSPLDITIDMDTNC